MSAKAFSRKQLRPFTASRMLTSTRSFVIDTLSKTHTTVFYYLNRNDEEPGLDMAMSILKQCCEKIGIIPENLVDPTTRKMVQPITMDVLQKAFEQVAPERPGLVIVIDGLDEVHHQQNSANGLGIEDILALLMHLNFKILATSREKVFSRFTWTILFVSYSNADDVELFVSEAIKHREPFYHFPDEEIRSYAVRVAKESKGR